MALAAATVNSPPVDKIAGGPQAKRHDKYWLDDGSMILRSQDILYKVHRTLLHRHSNLFRALSSCGHAQIIDGVEVTTIPEELNVNSADVEALLEHLYHDA